jgi:hypothetical protein
MLRPVFVAAAALTLSLSWGFAIDGASAFVSLSNAFEKKPGEAGGMLFVNSGYGPIGFMAGNAILAFSVEGR